MSTSLGQWAESVWEVLSRFPGSPEVVADQRGRWDHVRTSEPLRVVIFGAYDAGKSTLLKRLLVEAGTPVPEWLTISARRESFEVREVRSNGIVFADTPGLGSGNDDHDRSCLDAIKLADAFLWVLPPQLVTANKNVFLDVLSGRYFDESIPSATVVGSTIAAIARMDEAGIDPADNFDGFRELAQRKAVELENILRAGGVEARLRAVFCVAADPYQMVGSIPNPSRDLYDAGREWDGVQGLSGALMGLSAEREALRDAAGVRFVAGLAREVREHLKEMSTELEHALEGCANEIERHRLLEQRLNALRKQAAADLHRRVEEELLSTSRRGSASVADTAGSLEKALSRVVDEWSESCFADYRKLVGEVELEIRERMASPSLAGFRRFAEEAVEQESRAQRPGNDTARTGKRILGFGPALRKAFDTYARSELGMSLKTAADRLEKMESSGQTVAEYIKAKGREAGFRSVTHTEQASKFVKWGRVLDAVGPVVSQLGEALFEVADAVLSAQRAKELEQLRRNLRERLRDEAQKLVSEAAAYFDANCEGLHHWLRERTTTLEEGKAGLEHRLSVLREYALALQEALERFPRDG